MPKLFVLIGVSGAGKSTHAQKLNAISISSDEIRKELFGDENVQAEPEKVFALAHKRVKALLKANKDVVFDATNVSPLSRKALMDAVKGIECEKIGVVFDVNPRDAIRRQEKRERKVPEEVIMRQFRTLQEELPNLPAEFDQLQYIKNRSSQ